MAPFSYFRGMKTVSIILCACLILIGCTSKNDKLPILGNPTIIGNDTLYPTIPDFKFVNQDSIEVTNKTFEGKIYVADFIFLSCPTVCPRMTNEMMNVYEAYKSNPHILYISHTIDPLNDSIQRLKNYSENLGVSADKWHFVTGTKEEIFSLAEKGYFSTAYPDSNAAGGYVHSAALLLVDKFKRIRGVYDGMNPNETERLKSDIKNLLKEQF